MFEATKVEKSKRNKRNHQSSNKSRRACAELQTIIYCCFSSDSANLLGTKNVLHKIFGRYTNHGDRKDAVEITSRISS